MIAYLITANSYTPPAVLAELLDGYEIPVESVDIGADPEAVIAAFKGREPGIVFIPPAWEDLFCIKVVNNLVTLDTPFETVIAGDAPPAAHLIAAFNAGLGGFVPTPVHADIFRQVIQRCRSRLGKKLTDIGSGKRLTAYEQGTVPSTFSPQILERDQLLAHAFMDLLQRKGPLINQSVMLLLVSSSEAQRQRLGAFLRAIGIKVDTADGMEAAIRCFKDGKKYSIVISDNMLPDGDAPALVNTLHKNLKEAMPRFIVMTASPDKAAELLDPSTHIDDVIIKPGPGSGLEMMLPSVIAGIYQVQW